MEHQIIQLTRTLLELVEDQVAEALAQMIIQERRRKIVVPSELRHRNLKSPLCQRLVDINTAEMVQLPDYVGIQAVVVAPAETEVTLRQPEELGVLIQF